MSLPREADSSSGRKSVAAELHLVPYIDLLTCLVAFLLITAVWTQLARLEISQKDALSGALSDQDWVRDPDIEIAVVIDERGFFLEITTPPAQHADVSCGTDQTALLKELQRLKLSHPDTTAVQIRSADGIRFELLVQVMDVVLAGGFPEVSLVSVS